MFSSNCYVSKHILYSGCPPLPVNSVKLLTVMSVERVHNKVRQVIRQLRRDSNAQLPDDTSKRHIQTCA